MVYLEGLSGFNLFSVSMLRDDTLIRKAMYMDLTRCWRKYSGGVVTHEIHDAWQCDADLDMGSRLCRSLVNGAVCGSSILRDNTARRSYKGEMKCRWCSNGVETLGHVLVALLLLPLATSAILVPLGTRFVPLQKFVPPPGTRFDSTQKFVPPPSCSTFVPPPNSEITLLFHPLNPNSRPGIPGLFQLKKFYYA